MTLLRCNRGLVACRTQGQSPLRWSLPVSFSLLLSLCTIHLIKTTHGSPTGANTRMLRQQGRAAQKPVLGGDRARALGLLAGRGKGERELLPWLDWLQSWGGSQPQKQGGTGGQGLQWKGGSGSRGARGRGASTEDDPDIQALKATRDQALSRLWWTRGGAATRVSAAGLGEGVSQPFQTQGVTEIPWCGSKKRWNTSTRFARFDMYGCLQVSGIHVMQTYLKTIVVIDRSDSNNTFLKLNNTNQNAYGEQLTLGTGNPSYPFTERALNVKSNVFCSSGQILKDGTLLSIGGSSDATNADPLLNGSFSIRAFSPCADNLCDFSLTNTMTSKRWYPTAQIMPSGRVLIVGGANVYGNIAINTIAKNNPTVEYYPRNPGEGNYYLQFLVDTVPFNLYAFVHVLPSGLVFMFANDRYTLYDSITNQEVPGNYPQLNATTWDGMPIARSYPVSGTSALLPLTSANNYTAEIMICGGNTVNTTYINGDRRLSFRNGNNPADPYCYRIQPEAPNPTWTRETMCNWPKCDTLYRRVMGDAVLLADGNLLIVNGAVAGYQGLDPGFAVGAQYQPLLYFTSNHSWYPTANLPASIIARMYHSSAILLHDSSVLITGSNPNAFINLKSTYPTEFRVERFIPPYLLTGLAQPALMKAPRTATVGSFFAVYFNATQVSNAPLKQRFTAALAYPGFSTHNQRHGMRHVILDVKAVVKVSGTTYAMVLSAPPNLNIAPPAPYWFYVLDNGIPVVEAASVTIVQSY